MLKSHNLFASKGKGKANYYIPGPDLKTELITVSTEPIAVCTEPNALSTESNSHNTEPIALSTEPGGFNTEANLLTPDDYELLSKETNVIDRENLLKELPSEIRFKILELKGRVSNLLKLKEIIKDICNIRPFKLVEIASLLQKDDNYLSRKYLKPMIDSFELRFQYPEMINHPDQAYKSNQNYTI